MPPMCDHHRGVYATRLRKLEYAVYRPESGREALAREARTVARQCRLCEEMK